MNFKTKQKKAKQSCVFPRDTNSCGKIKQAQEQLKQSLR